MGEANGTTERKTRCAQNELCTAQPSASTVQICYASWKPDAVGTSGHEKPWFPDTNLVNARVVSGSAKDSTTTEGAGHHETDPKRL